MSIQEVANLLALIQVYDGREVGDSTILAWHEALDEGLVFADARRVVVEFYASSRERIRIADINEAAAPQPAPVSGREHRDLFLQSIGYVPEEFDELVAAGASPVVLLAERGIERGDDS